MVMAELRRTRRGVSIPVTLCGRLGGAIRDLADVLDLGADQFLEEPFEDQALASTLSALAGPPPLEGVGNDGGGLDEDEEDPPTAVGVPGPRTEVIDGPQSRLDGARSKDDPSVDPAIGRLGRTLDLLEERLRSRPDSLGMEGDELERSLLGLAPAPEVDGPDDLEVSLPDVASMNEVDQVDWVGWGARNEGSGPARTQPISPLESTTRLEGISSTHATRDELIEEETASTPTDEARATPPSRGDLSVEDMPRVLWTLHQNKCTGRVDVTHGRAHKQLWLERGEIVFARSSVAEDRLINTLVRRGLLTRAQHDAARSLAAKEPRRVGTALIEAGFLKPQELPQAIQWQVESIVSSTFAWRSGGWSLEELARCDESIRLHTPLARVIVRGVEDRLEVPRLRELLGELERFPRLRAGAEADELAVELELDPTQRRLLEALDGRRSLAQLAQRAPLAERTIFALVFALDVLGLVEIDERATQADGAYDPAAVDRTRIEERLRLVREADYFEVLGLGREASAADVRRAHRALLETYAAEAFEPEVRTAMKAELAEIRAALDDAHDLLRQDDLRLAYLAHLGTVPAS